MKKLQYQVILKYDTLYTQHLTGCCNTVIADNAVEAVNKVVSYHKLQIENIISINVNLTETFPLIE